jgi:hypothetical protein
MALLAGSLAYIGNGVGSGQYLKQPGDKWRTSQDGFDTYDMELAGPRPYLQNLLSQYENSRGSSLAGYPGMYLVEVTSDEDRSWGHIYLTYWGWKHGVAPAPVPDDNICTKTASFVTSDPVSVQVYDTETGEYKSTNQRAHRDISYNSPETTWAYTSNQYLTHSRGLGVQGAGQGDRGVYIFRSVITLDDGTRYSGLAPVGLVSALHRNPDQILNDFSCNKVQYTPYYICKECWAYEYESDT